MCSGLKVLAVEWKSTSILEESPAFGFIYLEVGVVRFFPMVLILYQTMIPHLRKKYSSLVAVGTLNLLTVDYIYLKPLL